MRQSSCLSNFQVGQLLVVRYTPTEPPILLAYWRVSHHQFPFAAWCGHQVVIGGVDARVVAFPRAVLELHAHHELQMARSCAASRYRPSHAGEVRPWFISPSWGPNKRARNGRCALKTHRHVPTSGEQSGKGSTAARAGADRHASEGRGGSLPRHRSPCC
jgi:hypothetical protein